MQPLFLDDEQCVLLSEVLDLIPLTPRYMAFVVDLQHRIPKPEALVPAPGSTPPAVHSSPTGGGFQLVAHTLQAQKRLESLMARLPYGDGL